MPWYGRMSQASAPGRPIALRIIAEHQRAWFCRPVMAQGQNISEWFGMFEQNQDLAEFHSWIMLNCIPALERRSPLASSPVSLSPAHILVFETIQCWGLWHSYIGFIGTPWHSYRIQFVTIILSRSKPAQGADNSPLRLAGSNLRPHALCTDGDIAYTCIAA